VKRERELAHRQSDILVSREVLPVQLHFESNLFVLEFA
jgi:hypothetical protein